MGLQGVVGETFGTGVRRSNVVGVECHLMRISAVHGNRRLDKHLDPIGRTAVAEEVVTSTRRQAVCNRALWPGRLYLAATSR